MYMCLYVCVFAISLVYKTLNIIPSHKWVTARIASRASYPKIDITYDTDYSVISHQVGHNLTDGAGWLADKS